MLFSRLRTAVAGVACSAMLVAGAAPGVLAPTRATAQEMPPSFAPVAKDLLPSVVNIATTRQVEQQGGPLGQLPEGHPLRDFFERFGGGEPGQQRQRRTRSLGSGFVIDEAGYVVTNHHVIKQADQVSVVLQDDTRLEAEVVGADPKTDLALLKVDAERALAAVDWGDSATAEVGDWVLAIGNPFGLGGSVTAGIVSARGRAINAGPYSRFIQTDTAINRGNSGGPLFNTDGEVIGVNTAILSPSGGNVGVGFALPSKVAQPIIAELKANGEVVRGWLGVSVQPVTDQLAQGLELPQDTGALIGDVRPNSPAEQAGLKSGDVVVGFDGEAVNDPRDLAWKTSQRDPGETVELALYRDGARRTVEVELGRLSDAGQKAAAAERRRQARAPDRQVDGRATGQAASAGPGAVRPAARRRRRGGRPGRPERAGRRAGRAPRRRDPTGRPARGRRAARRLHRRRAGAGAGQRRPGRAVAPGQPDAVRVDPAGPAGAAEVAATAGTIR
ncbi:MAG: Do family serine endopeptidase [Rhodovibrio sp.]|nr:Do family serine endopeptidase [Rhodovibrio sp.]